jgi:hypothetical protein
VGSEMCIRDSPQVDITMSSGIEQAEYIFEFWKTVQDEYEKTMTLAKFDTTPRTRRQLKTSRIGSWSTGRVGSWSSDDYDWEYPSDISDEPIVINIDTDWQDSPLSKKELQNGGFKTFSQATRDDLVKMMKTAPSKPGKDFRFTYPTENAKHHIMNKHGLTERQVNDFASNYRRRVQKKAPRVDRSTRP